MTVVGTVQSLWRYPVKSMRGEELEEAFLGFGGIYGDRLYAFHRSSGPKSFPYLTGREQAAMLLYRPRFRHPEKAAKPLNLAEAESLGSGVTPIHADPAELAVDVEAPSGERFAINDLALARALGGGETLKLLRSDHAMTDCRPVSIFGVRTASALGPGVDPRRFRANVYGDFESGFLEDSFVGKRLRIGVRAVVYVLDRDARCQMVTLDPDTAESNPGVLRAIAKEHEGKAGVYAAVLIEGMVRKDDPIEILG
jgi:hypothetical protein